MASPPTESTPPIEPAPQTIVYRAITLRVDLRALAALGGALIIIGALLPWVTPLFETIQRMVGSPSNSGNWLVLLLGILAILIVFLPRFKTPRVSTPAAAFGLIAGLMALNSALNTLGLRQIVTGDQTVSSLSGLGLGVYITLAGSIIAILAGLAPQPPHGEAARAEIRLWQPSFAIFGSLFVILVLSAIGLGLWLGGGGSTNRGGTPTPSAFDAGLLGTPLINAQVNPLASPNAPGEPPTPPPAAPTAAVKPTEVPPPTFRPPPPTTTSTLPPTATSTPPPTQPVSPQATPTQTATPTTTATATITPTVTSTTTATATATATSTPTPSP